MGFHVALTSQVDVGHSPATAGLTFQKLCRTCCLKLSPSVSSRTLSPKPHASFPRRKKHLPKSSKYKRLTPGHNCESSSRNLHVCGYFGPSNSHKDSFHGALRQVRVPRHQRRELRQVGGLRRCQKRHHHVPYPS